jgi:hypothetical protein
MTMFQNLQRMMGEAATLKLECDACGRQATWTRHQAMTRLGPDAAPFDIRRRLACEACGVRGRARVWI